MVWVFFIAVAVLVAGLGAALILGRITYDPLDEAVSSTGPVDLPEGLLTPRDIDEIHFDTALRGYRMDQVDDVLDRLLMQVADQEREIRRLRDPGSQ
ncbi:MULTISPECIES: DivIVA domain-containing protein [unclassified Janibacter]|uniref:DivIVA domain-containing protein n=1 Tax=unclassified Janibacter TaxID=2649294 RepID=UPI003D073770